MAGKLVLLRGDHPRNARVRHLAAGPPTGERHVTMTVCGWQGVWHRMNHRTYYGRRILTLPVCKDCLRIRGATCPDPDR